MIFMVNKDHSVGDNSMINSSIKVMQSLSAQIDNHKCENQDPNHLKWQLQANNDPMSNSNKTNSFMVYHQNIRGLLSKTVELISFLSPNFPQVYICQQNQQDAHFFLIIYFN
jgi:hypothetical protein